MVRPKAHAEVRRRSVRTAAAAAVLVASLTTNARAQKRPPPPDRGWQNPTAFELAKEGIAAKKAGDVDLCIQKDLASLALEDHPYVRIHLSGCYHARGRLVLALVQAREALAAGIRRNDEELKLGAQKRVQELLPKIPYVVLKVPANVGGAKITFDGAPVRPDQWNESRSAGREAKRRIPIDPGTHLVTAERDDKGDLYVFKEEFEIKEGDEKTVEIVLHPSYLSEPTRVCLESAKTYEEKLACPGLLPPPAYLNTHVGVEMSGYTDSTNVHVITPALNASVTSPTAGWNVGGSYLLDVVTAASPDIVSMASGHFREQRHAGSLGGGYKPGLYGVQAHGNVSREPDYLSMGGGLAGTVELDDKRVTPRLGYSLSYDRIGIRNTPFSQFERNLTTHEIEAGVTFVLSPTTLLVTGATISMERGELSKLYRFVPMFSERNAALVVPGSPVEDVNALRSQVRARESLPRARDRIALGARINHRFSGSTLRVDERLYTDSWGVKASTTDARYLIDLGDRLRIWPHLRFHGQLGTNFYRLAYVARDGGDDGQSPVSVYRYRTGDRELSPMMTVTVGGGTRIALNATDSTPSYALVVSGEVMYSKFFESLFVTSRTAVYGTVGFEAEF